MNIGLDMMGGDFAPLEAIKGIKLFRESDEGIMLTLFGDESKINSLIQEYMLKQGRGTPQVDGLSHELHKEDDFCVPTRDSYLITCGACGYRDLERSVACTTAKLSQLSCLTLSSKEMEDYHEEKSEAALMLPVDDRLET
jgi:hypothetical protein